MAQSVQGGAGSRRSDEHLSAWGDVLGPLLDKMSRARWNNVRWQHIVRSPIDHSDYLLAASFGGKVFSTTSFRGPSRATHPGDLQHWSALGLLSSWALEVSRARGMKRVDPRWLVLSTFPGSQDHIPPEWIEIAKDDPTISWYRWKCCAGLVMHKRVRGMSSYRTKAGLPTGTSLRRALLQFPTFPRAELQRLSGTLPEAVSGYWDAQPLVIPDPKDILAAFPEYGLDGRPVETRMTSAKVEAGSDTADLPTPPEAGEPESAPNQDDHPAPEEPDDRPDPEPQPKRQRGRRSDITFPPKWAMAVEKFVVDIPKSAKTYRAILRRVVRLSGSFDPRVCQAFVDGPQGTTEMRSVWNRFVTTLSVGAERAPTFLQAAARRADRAERARVERYIPRRLRQATGPAEAASASGQVVIPNPLAPVVREIPKIEPIVPNIVPIQAPVMIPAAAPEVDATGRPLLPPADDAPQWATESPNKYIRMLTQIPGVLRDDRPPVTPRAAPDRATRDAELARMAEESEAKLRESDRAYREEMAREIAEAQAAAASRKKKPRFAPVRELSEAELSWSDDEDD